MKKTIKSYQLIHYFAILMLNTTPSLIYALETNQTMIEQQVQETIDEVDQKLEQPLQISENELNALIQEKKALYPDLSEEKMREIAYRAMSPYSIRASVWNGKGVTLNEFAFAFDVVVTGLLGGIGSIPKYAAKKGLAATKAMLSRAAVAAAKRAGVYAGMIPGILTGIFNVINIYANVGYAVAKAIDARDYYPNNGRINAWA
ncbi:hypothetical protein CAC02_04040 [Streptococcus gallolyticus]|uniref:Uncharacterized protein n=1 Tax=Streptococcus gallolyticus TaxID=315405 RepID=A0A368UF73_9STRE|nr:hypothetical protein [Streptococcus gallolyticus]RCW17297.1 hypothetical protein CAC02_04040 [Streptococcus gallolyticus]